MPLAILNERNEFVDWVRFDDVDRGFINGVPGEHIGNVVVGADGRLLDENLNPIVNVEDDPPPPLPRDWMEFRNARIEIRPFPDPNPIAPQRFREVAFRIFRGEENPVGPEVAMAPMRRVEPNMENGPELWSFVLEQIRTVYECPAVIAGGCVRDHMLGFEPKDIDIFIDHNFPEIITQDAPELNWGGILADASEDYEGDAQIKGSWSFANYVHGFKINLIGKPLGVSDEDYAAALVKGFDFNICKGWFDGKMHNSDLCNEDIYNKTFTYVGPDKAEAKDRSIKRFKSFLKRSKAHKEFKLVGLTIPKPVKIKDDPFGKSVWSTTVKVEPFMFLDEAGNIRAG